MGAKPLPKPFMTKVVYTLMRPVGQVVRQQINGNVAILMNFASLAPAALKVVKLATFSAASDENFVKMTIFSFH